MINFVDPFMGLSDELHVEMQQILEPAQAAGLAIERDPVLPTAIGIGIDRGIYRVALVTNPQTQAQRIEILDPSMRVMSKADFHALISAFAEAPPPVAAPLGSLFRNDPEPVPIAMRQLAVLEAILLELQEIKARLP